MPDTTCIKEEARRLVEELPEDFTWRTSPGWLWNGRVSKKELPIWMPASHGPVTRSGPEHSTNVLRRYGYPASTGVRLAASELAHVPPDIFNVVPLLRRAIEDGGGDD